MAAHQGDSSQIWLVHRIGRLKLCFSWTLLAAVLLLVDASKSETIRLSTEGRDPGVPRWISYEVVGPKDSPTTIIYFSTQQFQTYALEGLFLLSQRRYDILSSYTQQRLAAHDCPGAHIAADAWNTVKITQHEKSTVSCLLPQVRGCAYLANVVHLADMRWSSEELDPI